MLPYRFDYAALRVGLIFVSFGSLRASGDIDDEHETAGFIDDAVRGMAHDGFGMNLPPAAHPSLSKERRQGLQLVEVFYHAEQPVGGRAGGRRVP